MPPVSATATTQRDGQTRKLGRVLMLESLREAQW